MVWLVYYVDESGRLIGCFAMSVTSVTVGLNVYSLN